MIVVDVKFSSEDSCGLGSVVYLLANNILAYSYCTIIPYNTILKTYHIFYVKIAIIWNS